MAIPTLLSHGGRAGDLFAYWFAVIPAAACVKDGRCAESRRASIAISTIHEGPIGARSRGSRQGRNADDTVGASQIDNFLRDHPRVKDVPWVLQPEARFRRVTADRSAPGSILFRRLFRSEGRGRLKGGLNCEAGRKTRHHYLRRRRHRQRRRWRPSSPRRGSPARNSASRPCPNGLCDRSCDITNKASVDSVFEPFCCTLGGLTC